MSNRHTAGAARLLGRTAMGAALILGAGQYALAHGDEKHPDASDPPASTAMHGAPMNPGSATMSGGHMDDGHAHDAAVKRHETEPHHDPVAHGHAAGGHSHDQWVPPPPAYAQRHSDRWADPAAIARGAALYEQNCASCHGSDGRGGGPAAKSLAHPPADLSVNFHHLPHDGDAYLFWRVSEGGTVEPFKSQRSQMPAFKSVLSEGARWDVLAYVHAYFHLGLYEWRAEAAR